MGQRDLHLSRGAIKRLYVEDAKLEPKPVNGTIPIIIGAARPQMRHLTGAVGDGWLKNQGWPESPEEYVGMLREVEEGAEQAGRDPTTIRRHMNSICYIGDDDPTPYVQQISPLGNRTRGLFGTADKIIEGIEQYVELGLDSIRIQFLRDRVEEQVQRFGEEVIAKLRS